MKKILVFLLGGLALGFVGAYISLATIGFQGSGYAAKNLCSGVFVNNFSAETVMEEAIIPASPPLSLASYSIDNDLKQVRSSMLGMYAQRAQFRPGLGCTIIPRGGTDLPKFDIVGGAEKAIASDLMPIDQQDLSSATDKIALEQALDIAFAENDARGNKNTKALLVLHNGKLIAERYAADVDASTPLLGWSMTKSVTNMLVGILVRDGRLSISEPAPVPEWQGDDPRSAITIDHLLRMSSGLEFNETYGMNTDVSQMLTNEADTGAFAAAKPLLHPPGEFWNYSSGTTNILARMVQQQVGGELENLYQFAQEELFQPLMIARVFFEPDASGVFVGSSFLHLSGRNWAKLGQLMLQNGNWQGRQILPENWVKYSITPADANKANEYGAHFWLNLDPDDNAKQRTWPDVPADAFSMNGYQGQHVVIIPSRQLVMVRLGFTPLPARPGMNQILKQVIDALN